MNRPASTLAAALALLLAGTAADARAAIYVYTETTLASGSLNGVSFSNASLTFTQTADSSSIIVNSSTNASVQTLTSTVAISGIGTASFTLPTTLSVTSPAPGGTYFDLTQGGTLINRVNLPLSGTPSAFLTDGPDSRYSRGPSYGDFTSFATSAGTLNITFNVSVGDVRVTPQTNAVPEPSSLALAGIGLASTAVLRRRRRRAARA